MTVHILIAVIGFGFLWSVNYNPLTKYIICIIFLIVSYILSYCNVAVVQPCESLPVFWNLTGFNNMNTLSELTKELAFEDIPVTVKETFLVFFILCAEILFISRIDVSTSFVIV